MTSFINFTETNDHEGESWTFWIQYDGNVDELDKFRLLIGGDEYLNDDDRGPVFELGHDVIPEQAVDVLVMFGGSGYMAYHTKLTGTFTCPSKPEGKTEDWWLEDLLYKGGIKACLK